MKKKFQLAQE